MKVRILPEVPILGDFMFDNITSPVIYTAGVIVGVAIFWGTVYLIKLAIAKVTERNRLENDPLALPTSGNKQSIESLYRESIAKGKKPRKMKKVKKVETVEQVARKIT